MSNKAAGKSAKIATGSQGQKLIMMFVALTLALGTLAFPLAAFADEPSTQRAQYSITYYVEGGTNSPNNPTSYNSGDSFPIEKATKAGHVFTGWVKFPGLITKVSEITPSTTGNLILYATWAPNEFTITYDLNGGTNDPQNPTSYSQKSDEIVFGSPHKSGFAFAGWYSDQALNTPIDKIPAGSTGDLTLYAKWTDVKTVEISGVDRIQTTNKNALLAYPGGCATVIIATMYNFPDALAGSSLAGALDAPILLTASDYLTPATADTIKQLGATNVVLLGSDKVLSFKTAQEIQALTGTPPIRLAGTDRIMTQMEIYKYGLSLGLWANDTIIVADGMNFPDALSISSYAAAKRVPLFLLGVKGELAAEQKALLGAHFGANSTAIIVGDSKVVPTAVEQDLRGTLKFKTTRLAGGVNNNYSISRYGTSAAVADFCIDQGMTVDKVAYSTGWNYPDALVAGPTQGKIGSFVVLADMNNGLAALDTTTAISDEVKANCTEVRFLGSTKVLSEKLRSIIFSSLWK